MRSPLHVWKDLDARRIAGPDIAKMVNEAGAEMIPEVQKEHIRLLKLCAEDKDARIFPYSISWLCWKASEELKGTGKTEFSKTEVDTAIMRASSDSISVIDPSNDDARIVG